MIRIAVGSSTRAAISRAVARSTTGSCRSTRPPAPVLDEKVPADSVAFKTWLNGIAEKVAEASKEGGFLGFGGVPVSEAEKGTLEDIGVTLALTRSRD